MPNGQKPQGYVLVAVTRHISMLVVVTLVCSVVLNALGNHRLPLRLCTVEMLAERLDAA